MKTGKQYLGEACKLYTLNGIEDAKIELSVFEKQYARIASTTSKQSIIVNWPTVARKMEGDKTFYAC